MDLAELLHFPTVNPNIIKSYKILQKLSPKHAAHGVAQSTYLSIGTERLACLNSLPGVQLGDPRLARGRSRVRAPGPGGRHAGAFFSTLPSFLLREIVFLHLPHQPRKSVRVNLVCYTISSLKMNTIIASLVSFEWEINALCKDIKKKLQNWYCSKAVLINMLIKDWQMRLWWRRQSKWMFSTPVELNFFNMIYLIC